MATAFTPGLTVSPSVTIRKARRLPVKGDVVVEKGARVKADTVVAKVDIPGTLAVVKVAPQLGCAAEDIHKFCFVQQDARVGKNDVLAERKTFFGLVTNRARTPIDGTIEYISHLSGNIGVRGAPKPISCNAYISGTVVDIIEDEGVVVETTGALVQGIFGVGGERHAELIWLNAAGDTLTSDCITESHRGGIVMFGGRIDGAVLYAAAEHGLLGIVGASIIDSELMSFLGYDIGVAVTGEEDIPFTLILTEGFGTLCMPDRTSKLLESLSGSHAAINGATQIRAGVIRPELIVPREAGTAPVAARVSELAVGTPVRLIRRPHFGRMGAVTIMHEQPVVIDTGSKVRVVSVRLEDGEEVTVPRANVEILG